MPVIDAEAQALALRTRTDEPDFKVFTAPMDLGTWHGGPVVNMVGSSTDRDLKGDIMLESALISMCQAPSGLVIWLNHEYDLPDSLFGALLKPPNLAFDGAIADLHITSDVEMDNEAAARTYRYIQKGRRLGCSVGCRVDDASIDEELYESTGQLALLVSKVTPVEWSVVGMPCNQRSWVENAVQGVFAKSLDPRVGRIAKALDRYAFRDTVTKSVKSGRLTEAAAHDLASVAPAPLPRAQTKYTPIYWDPFTKAFGPLTKEVSADGKMSEVVAPLSRVELFAQLGVPVVPAEPTEPAPTAEPTPPTAPVLEPEMVVAGDEHDDDGDGAPPEDTGGTDETPPAPEEPPALHVPEGDAIAQALASQVPESDAAFWAHLDEATDTSIDPAALNNTVMPEGDHTLHGARAVPAAPGSPLLNSVPAKGRKPRKVRTPALVPPIPPPSSDKGSASPMEYEDLIAHKAWKTAMREKLTAFPAATPAAKEFTLADDGSTHAAVYGLHRHHGYTHLHVNDAAHTTKDLRAEKSDAEIKVQRDERKAANKAAKLAKKAVRADERAQLLQALAPAPTEAEDGTPLPPVDPTTPVTPLDPKIEHKVAMLRDLAEEVGATVSTRGQVRLPKVKTVAALRIKAARVAFADARMLLKAGATISQENLAKLQLAHDALSLVTDGAICQKIMADSTTGAPGTSPNLEGGVHSGVPITPLLGLGLDLAEAGMVQKQLQDYSSLATNLATFATALQGVDLKALQEDLPAKQAALVKSVADANAELALVKTMIEKLTNMPLGRATQVNARVRVDPGAMASWLDMAGASTVDAPADPEATGLPEGAVADPAVPGTYLHTVTRKAGGRQYEQRRRFYPAAAKERPALSASQMTALTMAEVWAYEHAGAVSVPSFD